ncbi:transposase [Streptomyces sp. V4I8]|uniref:transposase n=1 Tax=Streptomyces sp. V4I8 TaxID=3156469 RepID=UPI0035122FCB
MVPLRWGLFGKGSWLSQKRRKFTPEYREEAVKMVIETSRPVAQVARELGLVEGTLGNWVNAYRRENVGEEPPLTVDERERLREQERELRELRQKVAFLEKVAAYFAKDPR